MWPAKGDRDNVERRRFGVEAWQLKLAALGRTPLVTTRDDDGLAPGNLSRPAATVSHVSCVDVGPRLRRLLDLLHREVQVDRGQLEAEPLGVATSYGWVYQHQGRVALTGAEAYHAGPLKRRGMLGG